MQGGNHGAAAAPLYSVPKGRCLNPHAKGLSNPGTFPHPFYTTRLHQQATTCGEAAPLSPLYSAPEGRLLNLHAEGVSNLRTFARKAGVKLQPPCFPKESIKKAPSFESAFY